MKTTKKLISIVCVLLVCVSLFTIVASAATKTLPTLQKKSTKKAAVAVAQRMLNYVIKAGLSVDGIYGNNTYDAVYTFQQKMWPKRDEEWDGIIGPRTWEKLISKCGTLKSGSHGDMVWMLQQILNKLGYDCGTPDGKFGPNTKSAVKDFQDDHKALEGEPLQVDGKVGPKTWASLLYTLFSKYPTWVCKK